MDRWAEFAPLLEERDRARDGRLHTELARLAAPLAGVGVGAGAGGGDDAPKAQARAHPPRRRPAPRLS
jgi:hypothetical protein